MTGGFVSESEDSCSPPTPDEPLGLGGLSLRLGLGIGRTTADSDYDRQRVHCPRILTAKDFNSSLSTSSSSSSSLSSSSSSCTISRSGSNNVNAISGTKRTADSVNASSQVVGWPPIRSYRMNSLTNLVKAPKNEDLCDAVKKIDDNVTAEKTNISRNDMDGTCKQNVYNRSSFYVKVNMDGDPIGRKVDLNAHKCYKALAQTLQRMFHVPTANVDAIRSSGMEQGAILALTRTSELLDGSSGYVITYEDKDGDWMLVGDVPWEMFLNSVRRLRIMRTSEANGSDV